jgi:hypothetical protein
MLLVLIQRGDWVKIQDWNWPNTADSGQQSLMSFLGDDHV